MDLKMESIRPEPILKNLFLKLKTFGDGKQYLKRKGKKMNAECFEKLYSGKMSSKDERRDTFTKFEWSSEVSIPEMCAAGFCCLPGETGLVVCYDCKGMVKGPWNLGDRPVEIHRQLFPECGFAAATPKKPERGLFQRILHPRVVFDAVATTGSPTIGASVRPGDAKIALNQDGPSMDDFFQREYNRLVTFRNWPDGMPVSRESLAAAGFYREDDDFSDRVKCFSCHAEVAEWKEDDMPMRRHINESPRCPFVNQDENCGNERITEHEKQQAATFFEGPRTEHRVDRPSPPISDPLMMSPRYERYSKEEDRMLTFSSWPEDHCQAPESLVKAGFFSVGKDDQVACFFCGGVLLEWDADDIPFEEHADKYPDCRWMQIERSKMRVREMKKKMETPSDQESVTETEEEEENEGKEKITNGDSEKQSQIEYEPDEHGSGKRPLLPTEDKTPSETSKKLINDEESPLTNGIEQLRLADNNNILGQKGEKKAATEVELEELRDRNLCKICLDEEVGMLFLPCKHLSTCEGCSERLELCPICREFIDERIEVFQP